MKTLKNSFIIFDDEQLLAQDMAQDILTTAKKSIIEKGCFSIVLTGGKSVLALYRILSKSDADWNNWHIYIGDERCLPKGDKDRNDYIINGIWIDSCQIPKSNIHFIKPELGCNNGADEYTQVLSSVEVFDIVLLSVGEDGHIASLFPGHCYDNNDSVIVERNSPKYPQYRISMSFSSLNRAHNVYKIVVGHSKQKAVELWLQGNVLPVNQIKGDSESVYICKNAISKYSSTILQIY